MTAFLTGVVTAIGIAFGAHFVLTERPDLVERYVPFIEVPGTAANKFSSPNVRL